MTLIDLQYVPVDCKFYFSQKGTIFLFWLKVLKVMCAQFLAAIMNRNHNNRDRSPRSRGDYFLVFIEFLHRTEKFV